MKTLLHICCAPCAAACIDVLYREGVQLTGYWYNPNIHPYTEYKSRRESLIAYAQSVDLDLEVVDEYGLRPFVQAVAGDIDRRCDFCYASRLDLAARYAAQNGFDNFTTSLLISPYQKHLRIAELAELAAKKHKVEFMYRDFRSLFRQGQKMAREAGCYMQKYCGCIFSEEERYLRK